MAYTSMGILGVAKTGGPWRILFDHHPKRKKWGTGIA